MFSFMICLQTSHKNELANKQVWNSIIKTPRLTSLLMMRGRMWVKHNLSHYLTLVACWEFPNRILLRDPRIAQHKFPSNQPLKRSGKYMAYENTKGKWLACVWLFFFYVEVYLHSSIIWQTKQSKKLMSLSKMAIVCLHLVSDFIYQEINYFWYRSIQLEEHHRNTEHFLAPPLFCTSQWTKDKSLWGNYAALKLMLKSKYLLTI